MTEKPLPGSSEDGQTEESEIVVKPSKADALRTPLFQANHAARYLRQNMIKQIEAQTGKPLISYVSGDRCAIDHNDVMPFVDLLHNVAQGSDVDLLLHTSGGSIDAAEKLVKIVRSRIHNEYFRVIVPNFAKSAGTLIVLGADTVVMSEMSELGPIDPQVELSEGWFSVQNYLDAYQTHAETLREQPTDICSSDHAAQARPSHVEDVRKSQGQGASICGVSFKARYVPRLR